MKTETRFVFIGTESDAKKFVDPEPVNGREYTNMEYQKIFEDNVDNIKDFIPYFDTIQIQVPDQIQDVKDVLTPMMRIEVLKLELGSSWDLEEIERYIAFGEYPK